MRVMPLFRRDLESSGVNTFPASLMYCLAELEDGFNEVKVDPKFWEEYRSYYPYMGRPGQLHLANRLTEHAGGANI